MNPSILNPYDLPADGLATLRLMRKMFEQLSISSGNASGFLESNDRALFMFLAGVSPSFVGNVTGHSGNGAPVIHAPWLSAGNWAAIKGLLALQQTPSAGNDPAGLRWAADSLSVMFAFYCQRWVFNSAGRDLGEFFFASGWDLSHPPETLLEILNKKGVALSKGEIDKRLKQVG